MTTVACLRRKLQSIHPEGRVIVCIAGQPVPPHRPEDTLAYFTQGEEDFL